MPPFSSELPPATTSSATLLARLAASAGLRSSPCGAGHMVWRHWGEGAPLVLLHGGYGAWTHWLRNIEALAARYRVIAADLPGLGQSATPPAPHTPQSLAAILDRGIDAVVPAGERFHLVGFSFGALLGSYVAAARGARLRSFTVVGATSMGLRRAPMRPLEPMRRRMTAVEIAELQRVNLGILMFADPAQIDETAVQRQVETVAQARVKSRRFAPIDYLSHSLPEVTAPLAGIWGERDVTAYPYLAERGEMLRRIQPGATFDVIPGAGHWVQYEAADAFNRLLLDRLAAQDGGA